MATTLKKELSVAVILLAVGLLLLPVAIYWVGLEIIGEYAPDAGLLDLMLAIWSALLAGEWGAWLLVLSPYAVILLLRGARLAWRTKL